MSDKDIWLGSRQANNNIEQRLTDFNVCFSNSNLQGFYKGKLKNSQSAFNVDDSVSNNNNTMPSSQSTLGTSAAATNGVGKHETITEDNQMENYYSFRFQPFLEHLHI